MSASVLEEAVHNLEEAAANLNTLIVEKAPDWLMAGQIETVRILVASVYGIAPALIPSDLDSVQADVDRALKRARGKVAREVRGDTYSGPGLWLRY